MGSETDKTITVTEGGPYVVKGDMPLVTKEPITTDAGEAVAWHEPEAIDHRATYSLCRCGASANKPFCDGSHKSADWDPTLTPAQQTYSEASVSLGGVGMDIRDDRPLCVHAGFCGNEAANVWDMAKETGDTQVRIQAIAMISNCPSGALTYLVDDEQNEPDLPVEVAVVPDGPLWVQGGPPVDLPDGNELERRNRVCLCRCGQSDNKPLCDGTHLESGFTG